MKDCGRTAEREVAAHFLRPMLGKYTHRRPKLLRASQGLQAAPHGLQAALRGAATLHRTTIQLVSRSSHANVCRKIHGQRVRSYREALVVEPIPAGPTSSTIGNPPSGSVRAVCMRPRRKRRIWFTSGNTPAFRGSLPRRPPIWTARRNPDGLEAPPRDRWSDPPTLADAISRTSRTLRRNHAHLDSWFARRSS